MKTLRLIGAILCGLALLLVLFLGGPVHQLSETVLDADFLQRETKKQDLIGLGRSALLESLPPEMADFRSAVDAAITEQQEALQGQLDGAIKAAHAYFLSRSDQLKIPIDAEPLRQSLLKHLHQGLRENPPAGFKEKIQSLSPAEREQAWGELEKSIDQQVMALKPPAALTLDLLPAKNQADVAKAREMIALFRLGAKILLGAGVVLGLLVLWLGSSRMLGIFTLIGGTLVLGLLAGLKLGLGYLVAQKMGNVPEMVRHKLADLIGRLLGPLADYGIGCLIIGAALIVLWIFLRRKPASAADQSPLAWCRRHPVSVAVVALVLVAGLCFWPGDVHHRIKAAQWRSKAQVAQLAGDWPKALAAWRSAVEIRPEDEALAENYTAAQKQWRREFEAALAALTPEESYLRLRSPAVTEVRPLLTARTGEDVAWQIKRNTAVVATHLQDKFLQATDLIEAKKFDEARALMESMKPQAAAWDGFEKTAATLRNAAAGKETGEAIALAEAGNFAPAHALLEKLKKNPDLPADDLALTDFTVAQSEFMHAILAAMQQADAGNYAQALGAVDALEPQATKLAAYPGYKLVYANEQPAGGVNGLTAHLNKARANIRSLVTAATSEKIAAAIAPGRADVLQPILDGYAKLLGRTFTVTAENLIAEKDFARFQAGLTDVGLLEADKPASLAGLTLVERIRGRFTPDALADFTTRGYARLVVDSLRENHPARASYALELLRRASVQIPPEFERQVDAALQAAYQIKVHLPSSMIDGDGGKAMAAACRDAASQILHSRAGNWLTLSEEISPTTAVPLYGLQTILTGIETKHDQTQEIRAVRYQSGWRNENNPAYDQLAAEYAQAAADYSAMEDAQAQGQSVAASANTSGNANMAALGNVLSAVSPALLQNAADKMNRLHAQMANTSSTVQIPVYTDATYPVTSHVLEHAAKFAVIITVHDKIKASHVWTATLDYLTKETPGQAQGGVPPVRAVFLSPETVSARLTQDLVRQISNQPDGLFQLIADTVPGAGKVDSGQGGEADDVARAEAGWGYAALWQAGGYRVTDYPARENALRKAMGFPVAEEEATPVPEKKAETP